MKAAVRVVAAAEPAPPSTSAKKPPPPPPRTPGTLCFARGRPPATPPPSAPSHQYCPPLSAREVAHADAEIRKRFDTSYVKPNKLVVDFGCDPAYGTIDRVVFEDGAGHGGTLRIVRFTRSDDAFTVRAIARSHYFQPSITVSEGTIPASRLEPLLSHARVQMQARPHLIALSNDDAFGMGMGGYFSSNDFHLRLSLSDTAGRTTDRGFTGYETSDSQEQRLPMQIATEPLIAALAALPMTTVPVSEDDRTFFSERFNQTMREDAYWWVKERYILSAASLGTMSTIPALVRVAQEPTDRVGAGRRRESAFDTVRAITGWDPRKADDGTDRTPDEAAQALAIECGG